MIIEEIGGEDRVTAVPSHSTEAAKLSAKHATDFEHFVPRMSQNITSSPDSQSKVVSMDKTDIVLNSECANVTISERKKTDNIVTTTESGDIGRSTCDRTFAAESDTQGPRPADSTKVSVVGEGDGAMVKSYKVAPPAVNSYQFQAEWKTLRNASSKFYQYFKVCCNVQRLSSLVGIGC